MNPALKKELVSLFKNKSGLEIGGPSKLFVSSLPIYRLAKKIDGCNFSNYTVWEGAIKEGSSYNYYQKKIGYQFICEANNLASIKDAQYDFLLASHCLEHCANAIQAVEEWLRVVKPAGIILLVLPDKNLTFDHKRKITNFEHLLNDYQNATGEKDLFHVPEILELHDLSMDKEAGEKEKFKKRSLNNFENRCLHHHVFNFELLKKLYSYLGIEILSTYFINPYHQVIIGRKNAK